MEFVKIYKNAISLDLCDKLIRHFDEKKDHFQGSLGPTGIIKKDFKNNMESFLPEDLQMPIFKTIEKIFFQYYQKSFPHLVGNFKFNQPRIKKYEPKKGFYDWHHDASSLPFSDRQVAVIMYLNNVEKGGETSIMMDNKVHKVKPIKGNMLLFPANFCYKHKGEIPISGPKYIAVSFICFA